MFHSIRPSIRERMEYLEKIDARDREDGTPRLQRLRQIPPETGKFLALLARQTFRAAQVEDIVDLVQGDARKYLPNFDKIAFCILDAEKEVYADCYELVVPRLVKGGLLVADNAINHREALQPMLERALSDARVDALAGRMELHGARLAAGRLTEEFGRRNEPRRAQRTQRK